MENSSNNEANFLKGLFSPRRKRGEPTGAAATIASDEVMAGSSSDQEIGTKELDQSSPSVVSLPVPYQPKVKAKDNATLSELGNAALGEARRELGKHFNLQELEVRDASIPEVAIAAAVDRALESFPKQIGDIERAHIIIHLMKDLMGWGILQPLIDDPSVTDIHVYDYQTVVLQRGKYSDKTDLRWANHSGYVAFVDRLLLRLGKTLSTQQHTVDASFKDGVRICAIHESVCASRGPLVSIRVPRISDVRLESLLELEVAPPLIVSYLASLTRSAQVTIIVSGETGTGKTTLLKCLGTQFGLRESIVTVEDTPELNFQHPFLRSLVSRPPNVEGVGEVTLQEHIKSTLRMTPTRVILGEMRTPYAAESFLESAQTGHVGMSTIHARNAKETLVRLESLLGRAQKSVAVEIMRQQIALAVDLVIWMFRDKSGGKPRIGEIIEVGHYVEGAIQVRPMFRYAFDKETPTWRVESWASFFDDFLVRDGVILGEASPELTFDDVRSNAVTRRRNLANG